MAIQFETPRPEAPTGALAVMYGALFRPAETFLALGSEVPLGTGLAALVSVAVVMGIAFAPPGNSTTVLGLSFGIALGWLFLSWLLTTGALYLVGRLISAKGELSALLGATALAFLPFLLTGPMAAFAGWGRGGILLGATFFVLAVVWWLRILQAAVRGVMDLTIKQSVLALVGAELLLSAIPMTYTTLWVLTLLLAVQ